MPSWGHLVKSCDLRFYFEWYFFFNSVKTIRGKQEGDWLSQEGNTATWSPRNAIMYPSYHEISWNFISTMTSRLYHGDSRIWVAQQFPMCHAIVASHHSLIRWWGGKSKAEYCNGVNVREWVRQGSEWDSGVNQGVSEAEEWMKQWVNEGMSKRGRN